MRKHLSVIKSRPLRIRDRSVSPFQPHILAQVVPTVHETCRLLVATKVYAKSHLLSVSGVRKSFFFALNLYALF